jgi:dephospho-CoA kinase
MPHRLQRIALTGGIATGKSVTLRRLAELGAHTIDADVLAREAVAPGTPGLAAVVARFGSDVLDSQGRLDRARLGSIVFADASARADLEHIIHPAVYTAIEDWFAAKAKEAATTAAPIVAIADIPLLYETGQAGLFDLVVVAACPPEVQLERLMARDGLSETDARRRLAAQLPIDDKRARADIVIDTSGTRNETVRAIDEAWRQIVSRACG